MKRKNKYGVMLGVILLINNVSFINPILVEASNSCIDKVYDDADILRPMADEIVIKYRSYHGKLQYRSWNETLGKWVEPAWIDV